MRGKEKCKALKEIRKQIAMENDIAYAVHECTYQGECKGTCPKCEAELVYLERELEKKKSLGKAVAVVGIAVGSIGMMGSLTACSSIDEIIEGNQLSGETTIVETEEPSEEPTDADFDDTMGATTLATEEALSGEVEVIDDELSGDVSIVEPTEEPDNSGHFQYEEN